MTHDLLAQAARLQERAREVMAELKLEEIWSQQGRVVLVGSLRFGLMATPNIDLEVYTDRPQAGPGFAAVGRIAANPGVVQVQYLNFLNTPSDPGLYWRIDFQDRDGVIWDIDNWLVPHDHPHAGQADRLARAMEQCLTDDARRVILEIKTDLAPDRPGGAKPRGVDIYRAVLSGGVKSTAQFQAWIERNPPGEGIETWLPTDKQ